jgi:hypothetical protein
MRFRSSCLVDILMPEEMAMEDAPWSMWNLARQTDCERVLSLLEISRWGSANEGRVFPAPYGGLVQPYLYHAAPMSFFPMHYEPLALPSANWLFPSELFTDESSSSGGGGSISGLRRGKGMTNERQSADIIDGGKESGAVAWYSCPQSQLELLLQLIDEQWNPGEEYSFLEDKGPQYMINPLLLRRQGLHVTRHLQREGDLVLTAAGAVHWGVNLAIVRKVWQCFSSVYF